MFLSLICFILFSKSSDLFALRVLRFLAPSSGLCAQLQCGLRNLLPAAATAAAAL